MIFARYTKLDGTVNGFSAASCNATSSFIMLDASRVSKISEKIDSKKDFDVGEIGCHGYDHTESYENFNDSLWYPY
jgi:hypothetical protein